MEENVLTINSNNAGWNNNFFLLFDHNLQNKYNNIYFIDLKNTIH